MAGQSVTACPTCGQAVEVVSSGEGTSHYVGIATVNLRKTLAAALLCLRDHQDEGCDGCGDMAAEVSTALDDEQART